MVRAMNDRPYFLADSLKTNTKNTSFSSRVTGAARARPTKINGATNRAS